MSDDHYGRTLGAEADDHYGHQSQEAHTLPTEFAKAPSSSCLWCPRPNSSLLHTASGGSPLCPMPDDHYERTAEADDYYGRQSQEAQTPSSELTDFLTSWSLQQVVGFQQVVESNNIPLSPPEPSTASIPAPGLEAAKLLASVQGVNSTPLQSS